MIFGCISDAEAEKGNSSLKTDVDRRNENGVFHYDI